MNYSQVSRVSLSPDVVNCIVFWTKDAENILDKLSFISELGYNYYFQYTITPYGTDIERNLKPKEQIVQNFKLLSNLLGKHRTIWRYDPIIINEKYTVQYHKEYFHWLCEELSNYTNTVTISFVDYYPKLRLNGIKELPLDTIRLLAEGIGLIAEKYNIKVQSCCENFNLTAYGIQHGSCIDQSVIEKVCDCKLKLKHDKAQRKYCNCVESIDIGAYNTCLNGCLYCYANYSEKTVRQNYEKHDPSAEFLLGKRSLTDIVYNREQKSNKIVID